MNGEHDRSASPEPTPTRHDDACESLNDALDDLEDMLNRHKGEGEGDDETATDEPRNEATEPVIGDSQYSIPLLNDVVSLPVTGVPAPPQTPPAADDDYAESVQRMAERLSSEIDIIVQGAVDEAIDLLRRDIGERLREHLDITLPEILEELVHLRGR